MSLPAASFIVALLLVAQDRAASLPLVVTHMSIETCANARPFANGEPHIEVRNTGRRTILAWRVKFQMKYRDGTLKSDDLGVDATVDPDPAEIPPDHRTGSVTPGGTAAIPTPAQCGAESAPRGTTISDGIPTYVIFDDDTALGDERQIALVFEMRRIRQMFWRRMDAILKQATSQSSDAASVLRNVRERMEAEPDHPFKYVSNYEWFLDQMSPGAMARQLRRPYSNVSDP